jgi:hypothetical protein
MESLCFIDSSMALDLRFKVTNQTAWAFESMNDITRFTFADMTSCGVKLRQMSPDATCMEEAARRDRALPL